MNTSCSGALADFGFDGDARPTEIAEALAWAQARQEMLALEWAELNERG